MVNLTGSYAMLVVGLVLILVGFANNVVVRSIAIVAGLTLTCVGVAYIVLHYKAEIAKAEKAAASVAEANAPGTSTSPRSILKKISDTVNSGSVLAEVTAPVNNTLVSHTIPSSVTWSDEEDDASDSSSSSSSSISSSSSASSTSFESSRTYNGRRQAGRRRQLEHVVEFDETEAPKEILKRKQKAYNSSAHYPKPVPAIPRRKKLLGYAPAYTPQPSPDILQYEFNPPQIPPSVGGPVYYHPPYKYPTVGEIAEERNRFWSMPETPDIDLHRRIGETRQYAMNMTTQRSGLMIPI
jgi:hypothetical protein